MVRCRVRTVKITYLLANGLNLDLLGGKGCFPAVVSLALQCVDARFLLLGRVIVVVAGLAKSGSYDSLMSSLVTILI